MIKNEILEIDGKETLCRWELVKDASADFPTYRAVPIITKEEFLTCYSKWIKGEKERPQGEWIHYLGCGVGKAVCSECGQIGETKKYCGNCGAEMEGSEEE